MSHSGRYLFDQRKLPSYIKILNQKCPIKNVKSWSNNNKKKLKQQLQLLNCNKEINFVKIRELEG